MGSAPSLKARIMPHSEHVNEDRLRVLIKARLRKRKRSAQARLVMFAPVVLSILCLLPIHAAATPIRKPDDSNPYPVVPQPAATPVRTPHALLAEEDFPEWCSDVGIQTNLTIQTFDYPDYLRIHMHQAIMGDDDDDDQPLQVPDYDPIQVRGLAADRDIKVGEVVISIPFSAMFSVPTTIDADPILRKVMGPDQRTTHGWDDEFFELPLLTMALLYHQKLGKASPLHQYILVLETSGTENIPFLWSKVKLQQEVTDGIRRYSRGIYRDVRDIHRQVIIPLKQNFPELFLNDSYSFQNFISAFSLINSRHWHLPLPSSVDVLQKQHEKQQRSDEQENVVSSPAMADQLPPASLPTDEWVQEQGDIDDVDDSFPETDNHSFLAPIADLLNFGPPCTRGEYNTATNTFELIATCSFLKGQEITYYYSDDCDDIVIANYGFTHPIVPKCPGMEDLQQEAESWKRRALRLEEEVSNAYDELDQFERDLELIQSHLRDCGCDDYENTLAPTPSKARTPLDDNEHDHMRGSNTNNKNNGERGYNGIRKSGNHQASQDGDML